MTRFDDEDGGIIVDDRLFIFAIQLLLTALFIQPTVWTMLHNTLGASGWIFELMVWFIAYGCTEFVYLIFSLGFMIFSLVVTFLFEIFYYFTHSD